jgi:biofilm protein TabA
MLQEEQFVKRLKFKRKMKQYRYSFLFMAVLLLTFHLMSIAQQKVVWDQKEANAWFNKKEWLKTSPSGAAITYDAFGRVIEQDTANQSHGNGSYIQLANLKPHASINKLEFARQYHANEQRWNAAFSFLQTTDLSKITAGKHLIDGENVYALVTEAPARKEDTVRWEGHRNYADVHYVIRGEEKINVAPLSAAKLVTAYNSSRDIAFYTANGSSYKADPGNFFIFFPQDVHRPNLQLNNDQVVKKIVLKIKLTEE